MVHKAHQGAGGGRVAAVEVMELIINCSSSVRNHLAIISFQITCIYLFDPILVIEILCVVMSVKRCSEYQKVGLVYCFIKTS